MNQRRKRPRVTINPTNIEAIIVKGDTERLIEQAKEIGQALKDAGLSMAQIRGIFGTVRRIEMRWTDKAPDKAQKQAMRQLLLLKPKLEYQAQRQKEVEGLKNVLIPAIDQVKGDRKRFGHFIEFFEAILAYHVAAGGKAN